MEGRGMSKKKQRPEPKAIEMPVEQPQRAIEEYRHCPICWSGNGGYGCAYSKQGSTRYYKCCKTTNPDKSPCGHTWTAIVKLEVVRVEHRVVSIEGQR
jgi:hypothetical protein